MESEFEGKAAITGGKTTSLSKGDFIVSIETKGSKPKIVHNKADGDGHVDGPGKTDAVIAAVKQML